MKRPGGLDCGVNLRTGKFECSCGRCVPTKAIVNSLKPKTSAEAAAGTGVIDLAGSSLEQPTDGGDGLGIWRDHL